MNAQQRIENVARFFGYEVSIGPGHSRSYLLGKREVWVSYSRTGSVVKASFRNWDLTTHHTNITGRQKALKVMEYLDGTEGGSLPGSTRLIDLKPGDMFTFSPGEDDVYESRGITGNLKQALVRRSDGYVTKVDDLPVYRVEA